MTIACLNACGRVRVTRGLCVTCWNKLRAALARGDTTLAAEVEAGRLLPAQTVQQRKAWWRGRSG